MRIKVSIILVVVRFVVSITIKGRQKDLIEMVIVYRIKREVRGMY